MTKRKQKSTKDDGSTISARIDSCSRRLWRALEGPNPEREFARVPERDRVLFVAHWLIAEVVNGGFGHYFSNTSGGFAPEAADACDALGLTRLARITRRAIRKLGPVFSRKRAARVRILRALARKHPRPDLEFEGVVSPLEAALEGFFEREEDAFLAITNDHKTIPRAFSEYAECGDAPVPPASSRSTTRPRRAKKATRPAVAAPKKKPSAARRTTPTRARSART